MLELFKQLAIPLKNLYTQNEVFCPGSWAKLNPTTS
jgi:hypothetical protein